MSSEIKILNSKQIKTHLAAAAAFHNFWSAFQTCYCVSRKCCKRDKNKRVR